MRTVSALGALAFAVAACGSSAAVPPGTTANLGAAASCGPRDAMTLLTDAQARVFSRHGTVYGCARGNRRTYLLGASSRSRPGQPRVGVLALGGLDVAYSRTEMGVDTAGAEVVVRRLDNGRTIQRANAMRAPLGPESFQVVDRIVIRRDGAVAWTATGSSIVRHSHEIEVNRIDRQGAKMLDRGSGIAAHSLRLLGSRLTWRHGSATRSATLL